MGYGMQGTRRHATPPWGHVCIRVTGEEPVALGMRRGPVNRCSCANHLRDKHEMATKCRHNSAPLHRPGPEGDSEGGKEGETIVLITQGCGLVGSE